MVELLVHWKKSLATLADKDGSTPLHFAASQCFRRINSSSKLLMTVYKANPAAVYQADNKGFFPIHVAASVGSTRGINFFHQKHPDSVGLRNAKGGTFLHVAAEKGRHDTVMDACTDSSLAWIRNMQDNEGNTALHLALQARSFWAFLPLFKYGKVNFNLINNHGQTPLDISRSNVPFEMAYTLVTNTLLSSPLE
jgi:ankyrin repeat protein